MLYFGRYSEEKGINILVEACKLLPNIQFVFAGSGLLEDKISLLPNVRNMGFQTGKVLDTLIREARFSVCSSEVYENCPFSVMESQQRGTPVIGAEIGGIPELITDGVNGRLFKSHDSIMLAELIWELWDSPEKTELYAANCLQTERVDSLDYCKKILSIYMGENNNNYSN